MSDRSSSVAVVGLGEVGRPLLDLMRDAGLPAIGVDVDTSVLPPPGTIDVMHICFPFEIDDFEGETARYIERLAPRLTVIDSTVAVGTTRRVHERTGAVVAHSPVRGKHAHMREQLEAYVKFIGPLTPRDGAEIAEHFAYAGLRTRVLSSPEASELAKLTETTYFGLLITWAQQVERYCDATGADYEEVIAFYGEIGFLPPVDYFPGVIGGHCVMPNLEILDLVGPAALIDAIRDSNHRKVAREERAGAAVR